MFTDVNVIGGKASHGVSVRNPPQNRSQGRFIS